MFFVKNYTILVLFDLLMRICGQKCQHKLTNGSEINLLQVANYDLLNHEPR